MDDVEMSDVGAGDRGEEAKPEEEKVMADSGVAATVSVSLHPLVIMNISEHWTRSVFLPLSRYCFVMLSLTSGPRLRREDQCRFMEL